MSGKNLGLKAQIYVIMGRLSRSVSQLSTEESARRTYCQRTHLAHEEHKIVLVVDVFGHHLVQFRRTEIVPIAMYLQNFVQKRTNTPTLAGEGHQMTDPMRSKWLAQADSILVPSPERRLVQKRLKSLRVSLKLSASTS